MNWRKKYFLFPSEISRLRDEVVELRTCFDNACCARRDTEERVKDAYIKIYTLESELRGFTWCAPRVIEISTGDCIEVTGWIPVELFKRRDSYQCFQGWLNNFGTRVWGDVELRKHRNYRPV